MNKISKQENPILNMWYEWATDKHEATYADKPKFVKWLRNQGMSEYVADCTWACVAEQYNLKTIRELGRLIDQGHVLVAQGGPEKKKHLQQTQKYLKQFEQAVFYAIQESYQNLTDLLVTHGCKRGELRKRVADTCNKSPLFKKLDKEHKWNQRCYALRQIAQEKGIPDYEVQYLFSKVK